MTEAESDGYLTQAQRLIWAGQQLHPDVPLYNMVLAFRLEGAIDVEAFSSAFEALVSSTDALRTVFRNRDGVPQRLVRDDMSGDLEHTDLTNAHSQEETLSKLIDERATGLFDLTDRLFRSGLVKLADNEYVWWLAQHHLITDGWAAAIVYERMAELYATALDGRLGTEPLEFPQFSFYADFEQKFQTSDAFAEALAFWSDKATNDLEPLTFYGVAPPAGGSTRTDRHTTTLGQKRSSLLEQFTESATTNLMSGTSQFNVFATALFALLARITGERDLAILAPSHNRPSNRFKNTAGLFIEVLPLQVTVQPNDTFATLMERVGDELEGLLLHGRPGSSDATSNRAYPVLLNFINASFSDFAGMPMRSDWVHPGHGDADHALRLQVHDFDASGDWTLHFDTSSAVFDDPDALMRHFTVLFDAFLADPNTPIANVDLLTEDEHAALSKYNDTYESDVASSVLDLFDAQVAATPNAVAVRTGDDALSYVELDARSDGLAAHLAGMLGEHHKRVAIYLPRSNDLVVSVWAALKAGAAYVPIDRQYPADRISYLLADSQAEVIITNAELARLLPESAITTVLVDEAREPLPFNRVATGWDDPAYVMYTSGSTGEPKGVVVGHGGLANYISWAAATYGDRQPLTMPLYSSFGFDLTVTSLFAPLVTGGSIVVYPEGTGSDLSVLDVFHEDAVDVVKLTPSHLALLDADHLTTKRIRTLVVGGEDLRTSVARSVVEASEGVLEVINEYGPTEGTVACLLHRYDPVRDVATSVPLGSPITNATITIRDDQHRLVPRGVVGEIYIGGSGVALGYLDRPELTEERFIPDPNHPGQHLYRTGDLARWRSMGEMEFLGRADTQVKIRGFRIELGEIETALLSHEHISEAFVDVVETELKPAQSAVDADQCVRCGLDANHPDAKLDTAGVCVQCHFFETHREHADSYFGDEDELRSILSSAVPNDAGQDCVMLLSGGKDSTYALYQLVALGHTPIVFSLDNGFISEGAKDNIRRAVDELGLELVMGGTTAMNDIFADSLTQFSNVCQGCFKTVYTLGMNLARDRGVHHLVTGLSRGQIFETRLADLFRVGITDRDQVDAAIIEARRAYHQMDDAVRRSLDTSLFDDDDVFDSIHIVDYYRYVDVDLEVLYTFLEEQAPWVRPSDTGRSTNCLINNTGIFVHKAERGFHNYALPYSWDVRLGHKTKQEALEELDDEIDIEQVRDTLGKVGYTIDSAVGSTIGGTQKRLAAFYVGDIEPSAARQHLTGRVPDYMIPSYLVPLDSIPLTHNGKVDRATLPDPRAVTGISSSSEFVAPRTDLERELAELWKGVLDLETIGVNDKFIEMGGDSILNIQLVARARAAGIQFTPQQLFSHPTIAELAEVAEVVDLSTRQETTPVPTGEVSAEAFPEAGLSTDEFDDLMRTFGSD